MIIGYGIMGRFRTGYWAEHEFIKRNVGDIARFSGWRALERLVRKAERPMVKGLIALLFETGCRVSEAVLIRRDMVELEEGFLTIYGAPVLKKRKSAEMRSRMRNIPIPLKEPLVKPLLDWIDGSSYERLIPRGRNWAYKQVRKVDDAWWPHRFRAERATQLVVEYGFNVPMLMRWFNWSDTKSPTVYVQLDVSDLKKRMV